MNTIRIYEKDSHARRLQARVLSCEEGENGWLVPNSEKGIRDGLVHILMNSEEIREYKENLKDYTYDNETVKARTESILCGGSSSGQEL